LGIQDRIDDASLLWNEGRRESGLLLACIAVAARARQVLPEEKREAVAFARLLRDGLSVQLRVEFRGELWDIETLLYKWVRCELVHEAAVPIDIAIDDALGEGLAVRAGGAPNFTLALSPGWFAFLTAAGSRKAS